MLRDPSLFLVAHAYFALDVDILWDAVRHDVPELRGRVREMLAASREGC